MPTPFRTIIGSNHGKPHSRIWIEGDRLTSAGFTVSTTYTREITHGRVIFRLDPTGPYKVSGKGKKPIIDFTGTSVAAAFPLPLTHVEVEFTADVIVITA